MDKKTFVLNRNVPTGKRTCQSDTLSIFVLIKKIANGRVWAR
jgi:hypothetical protein